MPNRAATHGDITSDTAVPSFADHWTLSFLESVNVWINIYDKDMKMVFWNAMAEEISGFSREEVLGHDGIWHWHYPDPVYHKEMTELARSVVTEGMSFTDNIESQIVCRDGTVKSILWRSRALFDADNQTIGAVTFGYDVTDRIKAEEALKKAHRELSVLYAVASVTSGAMDLATVLERSLEQVLPVMDAEKGLIHLWNEETQKLHLAASRGLHNSSLTELLAMSTEGGIIGRVFRKEVPIATPNMLAELTDAPANVPSRLFNAYIGVPIKAKGKLFGVFSILGQADQQFSADKIAMLTSIGEQIGVAIENAQLYQKSHQLAVSEERRRLARELHDAVTQSLYSLTLFAEAGQRSLNNNKLDDAAAYLDELRTTAQNALREMRLLLYELRPLALESEGLVEAIQMRLSAVEHRVGIETHLIANYTPVLSAPVEQEIYRVVQEALNNVLRHASAQNVTVSIETTTDQLTVKVEDDGIGFGTIDSVSRGGIGLDSMRTRVANLGGTLQIDSVPGKGVSVVMTLALPQ